MKRTLEDQIISLLADIEMMESASRRLRADMFFGSVPLGIESDLKQWFGIEVEYD